MTTTGAIPIYLIDSGKRIQVEAEHWLDALKSVHRFDAVVVNRRDHCLEGPAYEAVRWADDTMISYCADTPEEALESARQHVEQMAASRRLRWLQSFDLRRGEKPQRRLVETTPVL